MVFQVALRALTPSPEPEGRMNQLPLVLVWTYTFPVVRSVAGGFGNAFPAGDIDDDPNGNFGPNFQFVTTAVPEPDTFLLIAVSVGVTGLGYFTLSYLRSLNIIGRIQELLALRLWNPRCEHDLENEANRIDVH